MKLTTKYLYLYDLLFFKNWCDEFEINLPSVKEKMPQILKYFCNNYKITLKKNVLTIIILERDKTILIDLRVPRYFIAGSTSSKFSMNVFGKLLFDYSGIKISEDEIIDFIIQDSFGIEEYTNYKRMKLIEEMIK